MEEISGRDPLTPKIFGRAIYGLSAEIGRPGLRRQQEPGGRRRRRQAYHVTSTPTGLASVTRIVTTDARTTLR